MNKDIEICKFVRVYLGEYNFNLYKTISSSELTLFQKLPIDLKKSYIVYGSTDLLNKFRAFYLTRCIKAKPLYMQCFINDYASELSSSSKDDYGLNVDQDLVFLYNHTHSISSVGRTEAWLTETILNKVTSRNRDGLVTIILSEVRVQAFEGTCELDVINLSQVKMAETKEEALKSCLSETKNNSGTVY